MMIMLERCCLTKTLEDQDHHRTAAATTGPGPKDTHSIIPLAAPRQPQTQNVNNTWSLGMIWSWLEKETLSGEVGIGV